VLLHSADAQTIAAVRQEASALCEKYPIY